MLRLALLLVLALPAAAQARSLPRIETALQPAPGGAVVGAGEGHLAWATGSGGAVRLWTVRHGTVTRVSTFACGCSAARVEVGTNHGGAPVALVTTFTTANRTSVRAVRLDTGATAALAGAGPFGLDHGTLYTARETSLYRAPLRGLRLGRATRLRIAPTGEHWLGVTADDGRVAVTAERHERIRTAFGAPRGRWRRAGAYAVGGDGPLAPVAVAGISRAGLITARDPEDGTSPARATLIGPKARRSVRLGFCRGACPRTVPALTVGGRLLAVGTDARGRLSVGLTAVAFSAAS